MSGRPTLVASASAGLPAASRHPDAALILLTGVRPRTAAGPQAKVYAAHLAVKVAVAVPGDIKPWAATALGAAADMTMAGAA